MKILYTGNNRQDAKLAADALHRLAPDVTVAWAGRLSDAGSWVAANQDLTAAIVEAQVQDQCCGPFVRHIRDLGITTPIVVVASEQGGPPLAALEAGADDYLLKSESLVPNLTAIVSRMLQQVQANLSPLRLLYVGDAALARKCLGSDRWPIEIIETLPEANGVPPIWESGAGRLDAFDILLVEHDHPGVDSFAVLRDVAQRRPAVPVILVVERDQQLAVPALELGSADCVIKTEEALRALIFRLDRRRRDQAHGTRPNHSKEVCESQDLEAKNAAVRERLEQQVRDGREADRRPNALSAHERPRESEARLQANIEHEGIERAALGRKLENIQATLQQAEQLRASLIASYQLCVQQASEVQDRLAEAVRARNALAKQLEHTTRALERAQQVRTADLAAAARQASRLEAELATTRVDGAARCESLEQRLARAHRALQEAEERVSAERSATQQTAARHADLESRFNQEREQREGLVRELARAEAALDDAERRHTREMTATAERMSEQLRERQSQYDDALTRLTADRVAVEQKLAETEAALDGSEQTRTSEAASFADQLAQQSGAFTITLTEVVRSRDVLEKQLADARLALERAQQDRAAEADAAFERLSQRETELVEAAKAQHMLELGLAAAADALQGAERRAADERLAAAERAAGQKTEFETMLADQAAKYSTLEQALAATRQKLTKTDTLLHEAEDRHASSNAAATKQLGEQQALYEARLAEAISARDAANRQLHDARTTLERVRQDYVAEAIAAAERLAREQQELRETTATVQQLERRLADAGTALKNAEQRAAADRVAAEQRAVERQAEFAAQLDQEAANRAALEQAISAAQKRIAGTEAALQAAEQRHAAAMAAATSRIAGQEFDYETRLAQAAAARDAADQQLREANASLQRSQQEKRVDAAEAAKRLSRLEAELAEVITNREALQKQVAGVNTALQLANERSAADRLAAEQQAAQRRADFESAIAQERVSRQAVERDLAGSRQALAESESARRDAEERHISATASAAAQFAEHYAELERRVTEAAVAHAALEQTHIDAQERHVVDMETATGRFAERRTQLEKALAEAAENRLTLERRLADVTTASEAAQQLVVSERLASARQAAERQREFDGRLSMEVDTRQTVEHVLAATRQELLHVEATLRDAEKRHTSAMTAAAARLSEQQTEHTARLAQASSAQAAVDRKLADAETEHVKAMEAATHKFTEQQERYEAELAGAAASRQAVEQRLRDAQTTLVRMRQESDANAVAATERLAERESALAAVSATHQEVVQRLVEIEGALKSSEDRALSDRTAAAQQARERQAEFEARLSQELGARNRIERNLAETRAAAERTRQASLDENAALTAKLGELEVGFTEQLGRERAAYETTLTGLQEQLRVRDVELDVLGHALATSEEQLQGLTNVYETAKIEFERLRHINDAELQRLNHDHAAVRQALEQMLEDAAQALARIRKEHVAEVASMQGLVAERDGQMRDQAARHADLQEASRQSLVKLEGELTAALAVRSRQIDQLQADLQALTREFEATSSQRNTLQVEADRVAPLTSQLEAIREENRRQFEQSAVGILRCTRAGALQDANQALIGTLGYRSVDQLRGLDFAALVFDSPDDLRWLIERCQASPSEAVETIWKRKDGSRLTMRLRAVQVSADIVEIQVEDLTTLRGVEERLRQAQRMEAVGRLAAEVAVTCDSLLRNVSQDAQQWLATVGGNMSQRYQGELIFGEVTRAAGFLRQLSVYGDTQTRALSPVDVDKVLRELEPILKRVAGDDIELVLPKEVSGLYVDVDPERVERVLVNVAAYRRARGSSGGRLIFGLARATVDRSFVEKHPNVRQGAHALITVTEVKATTRENWPIDLREAAGETSTSSGSERPGLDLGALQSLIRDCGGHLWMKAEPGGEMEMKIHLPLRRANPSRRARAALAGRSIGRWFQS